MTCYPDETGGFICSPLPVHIHDMNQTFTQWLQNHEQANETGTLWLLQNMIGSCIGWDSPLYIEAKQAWEASRFTSTN